MKVSTTKLPWIFLFQFLICCSVFSQSKADSLYEVNAFDRAALEYERIIFNKTYGNFQEIILKKASCYIKNLRIEDAINTLYRIDPTELNDSLWLEYQYKQALSDHLNTDFENSYKRILMVENAGLKEDRFDVLQILNTLEMRAVEEYEKRVHSFFQNRPDSIPLALNLKSELKARRLSTYFPGAGQFYSNKFSHGLISFLLNAGSIAFTGINYAQGYYVTGSVTGISLFVKFYNGGQKNAYYNAAKYNEKEINNVRERLISLFLAL